MLIVVNGYGYLDNNFAWSHKQLPVYQDGMNHTVFTHLLTLQSRSRYWKEAPMQHINHALI